MLRCRKQPFSTTVLRLNKISYSHTLLLPQTKFSPKLPQGDLRESLINKTSQDLYAWQSEHNSDKKPFVLHDGPPYANGDLHLGHALNKICKDIINRFQLIHNNALIKYRPGWDCHGLPIEMKVNPHQTIRDPLEIRQACRDLATTMIDRQRQQFLQYAIMTDFTTPYITMDHSYEINQLKVFKKLMERGLLSRQLKPVWWGCDTGTALAEAELEYNDNHTSVAIHVKFPVVSENLYEYIKNNYQKTIEKIQLLIWTSTPWTIPANRAVCVNEHMTYTLITNNSEYLVVAKPLVEHVLSLNSDYKQTNVEIPGSVLVGNTYTNPGSKKDQQYPVLHGDHVVDNAGTGLVHNAPAHGREDYLVAKKYDLSIDSVIDEAGKLVEATLAPGFQSLAGFKVTEPKTNVICANILAENNMLFHINKKFKHSYPYDWRSKTPVVQRATPQWFVNVDKIKPLALEAISKVKFVPETGKHRLASFIENRSEWCISRQRVWGVPLPLIYNKHTNEPVLDLAVVDYLIGRLDENGTDQWFVDEVDISRWLPSESESAELGIPFINGADYYKGKDTMDVWFDSGTSWSTLENQDEPADIYLEGSDQHRGWFQSSLLNKVITSNSAPFKSVITHGFITDGKGQKMSKSLGNVFSPQEAIEGCKKPRTPYLGPDGLRTWVASSNYKSDVNFSPEVLTRVSEISKKYRVTFKYLLGNLYDRGEPVAYEELADLDKFTLHSLYKLQQECVDFYQEHNFSRVMNSLNLHVNSMLSAIYFDISKDCLYTDKKDSLKRRSIQTVLDKILVTYIGLLAPIQPLLTQEVWTSYREIANVEADSPFKLEWNTSYQLPQQYENEQLAQEFSQFFSLRDETFRLMEVVKKQTELKNKLQYEVVLTVKPGSPIHTFLQRNVAHLDDFFLVSNVILEQGDVSAAEKDDATSIWNDQVAVQLRPSPDHKCPRCWKFTAPKEDELCHKCHEVVDSL
ncbi:uncharacterized protein SPAPADRAFT_54466 [Spathaspora passalidarum NRRL Y-27907]|uniref:isoleucine--tRNA ligase n=1 Tax=Spathaspora passalidarum (strain NRRL Y-27907 / 11-Y1) TaxID=619300 RepID=G3AHZ9_SPAPN|nr:uncharacterized protein SPAPADRAFT_54466 [Spathaspora passalidarum NRRL Y-27907]EGW34313.1 hypothetical protein SPAPADRAFT_54466 [Spathaspora passalidarum NRRL Y-27907]